MSFFLICGVPLSLLILIGVYFTKERDNRSYLMHALYGLLLSVPVLIVHTLVKNPVPKTYLFKDIFINALLFRTFQLFVAALFMYHIPFGFRTDRRELKFSASLEWQALLFFGAFYSAASLLDAVLYFGDYNIVYLFYVPLSRIAMMCAATVAISFSDQETGVRRIVLYLGTLAAPLVFTFGFPLFYLNMYGLAVLLTVLSFGGSLAAFHLWMTRQYEPGGKRKLISLRAR